jgi:(5-formylfuran-3-yl)methyl phosphate synthase
MRLLVSVRDATEAEAALAGGADIIDAKNPGAGALGAVSLTACRDIVSAVRGTCPVTAALGDANDIERLARDAAAYVEAGASLVKAGFAGVGARARLDALLARAAAAAGPDRVIAVAYADHQARGAPSPDAVIAAAAAAGIAGVLLDTAVKDGPGLRQLIDAAGLQAWVARARRHRLLAALAGRLEVADVGFVGAAAPDVAGFRGAACEGGRDGCVAESRVRLLRRQVDAANRSTRLSIASADTTIASAERCTARLK